MSANKIIHIKINYNKMLTLIIILNIILILKQKDRKILIPLKKLIMEMFRIFLN